MRCEKLDSQSTQLTQSTAPPINSINLINSINCALITNHRSLITNHPLPTTMLNYNLTHLKELESESIFVIREVAAQFERPVMLFSGGKDSIVMSHLARKAFHPARIPFPLLHIDTGHNFPETITYRDWWVKEID